MESMWVDIYSERGNQRKMLALGIGEAGSSPPWSSSKGNEFTHGCVFFRESPKNNSDVSFGFPSTPQKKGARTHSRLRHETCLLGYSAWRARQPGKHPSMAGWLDGWMVGWLANRPKSCTHWTTSCFFCCFCVVFFN